jgi:hypothetical protein
LITLAAAAAGTAQADVYRSVDAQGHVQYSDTPTPGAELVHVQRSDGGNPLSSPPSPASRSEGAVSSSAAPRAAPPDSLTARQNAATQADLDRQKTQQDVQQDLEKERADQCKKATDDYQSVIAARRIYRTGTDGERQYLTDDEAEQQRVQAHQAMQLACGN